MDSNIIRDLVEWVECHLEEHLHLDDIAEKSGYSKWHLQRAFKETAKITLGTYVRYRRLSKVAIELRLTKNSMNDIATKYCFDSPQSFSRAFKRHFKISPGAYRRSEEWITRGILPALYSANSDITATTITRESEKHHDSIRAKKPGPKSISNFPPSEISTDSYEFTPLYFHSIDSEEKKELNPLYLNNNERETSFTNNAGQEIKNYFSSSLSLINQSPNDASLCCEINIQETQT